MHVARRVYLYAIALIALGVLVTGLAGLLQVAIEAVVERLTPPVTAVGVSDIRGRISFSGALTAAGLAVWLIHWLLAERPVRRGGPEGLAERGAALRRLYVYAALGVGGVILTFALRFLVSDLVAALLGQLSAASLVTGRIVEPLSLFAVTGGLWLYHWRVAASDRALAPEVGASAALRRWFVYGVGFVALLTLLFGVSGLIGSLWEALVRRPDAAVVGPEFLGYAVADRAGSILGGLAAWLLSWRWANRWLAVGSGRDAESASTLRKVYLYLVLAIAVAWTVWSLGGLLYGLIRVLLLGGGSTVARDVGEPIARAAVFGLAWLYHARALRGEAALAAEQRSQATIRLLYEYLVALVALVALAFGLGGTLATLIDLAVQPGLTRQPNWWQERISLFATLAAVGLPLWMTYWTRLEREALEPPVRGSIVRRIYLLAVFAATVLTLLSSGVFALYQLLRLGLGESWSAGQTTDLLIAASAALTAGLLLAYHLTILRRDAAAAIVASAEGGELFAVALVRTSDPATMAAFEQLVAERAADGMVVTVARVDGERFEELRGRL